MITLKYCVVSIEDDPHTYAGKIITLNLDEEVGADPWPVTLRTSSGDLIKAIGDVVGAELDMGITPSPWTADQLANMINVPM